MSDKLYLGWQEQVFPSTGNLTLFSRKFCQKFLSRVFVTWPASMQIYWNKRKRLHKKRVQLPRDWFGKPTWPPWRHVALLFSQPTWSFCHVVVHQELLVCGLLFKRQDTSREISTETNSKGKITATSTSTKQRSIQIFSYSQLPWRRRAVMMCCTFTPPIGRWLRSSFDARFALQQRKDGQKKQDKQEEFIQNNTS